MLATITATLLLLSDSAPYKNRTSLRWPLAHPVVVQSFGITDFVRNHPDFYRGREHLGIDVTEAFGAPVFAAADGKVLAIGNDTCPNYSELSCNGGYGNWILLWHEKLGIATMYQHLLRPPGQRIGETVAIGDAIGNQGASGNLIGPSHLHFAVFEGPIRVYVTGSGNTDFWILNRKKVKDPTSFLPPP